MGKYRGAAHTRCNINYNNNRYLPVVFNNSNGYDSHLILKEAFEICGTDIITTSDQPVGGGNQSFRADALGC